MSFMNRSCAMSRLFLPEQAAKDILCDAVDRLRRFSFHPIDDLPETRAYINRVRKHLVRLKRNGIFSLPSITSGHEGEQ